MKDHFIDLVVKHDQPVVDAIAAIERGPTQISLVVDDARVLVGVLTNGDIRRFLMQGGQTSAPVHTCMNRKFHALPYGTTREELLKLFDLGYNAVPLLDEEGRIVEFATPDFFPPTKEAAVLSRARAPVRISFSGGGTDLTYYFMKNGGVVLNASIALYAHATLIPSASPEINIISHDIDRHEHYSMLRNLLDSPDKSLLSSVVSVIRPDFGFDLYVHSDFPVGSGLGGSSAVATSVVGAFNELRLDKWSTYEIAEIAFQAERLSFSISGGWQDQYASAFGGFNLIEFDGKRNMVHSLRLEEAIRNELEECLVLCDTGIEHDSGKIHEQQREDFHKTDRNKQLLDMVALCRKMHRHLIRGDLSDFGASLHEAWVIKHGLSAAISGNTLDSIYKTALDAGALGGKLLGAGGGGFFLFYVQPRNRAVVCAQLKSLGCTLSTVRFEPEGVTSWRTKVE
ncbi:CBS domain-containing protein [Burkholderia plantarii]|uniref:GHMP family kinase ATP-binding protein n=1 Tax=Burkholderia plantarii TaxID=41899 RepID=UPI0006D89FA1|nr:CBS domain-containing protein [Burkholderia plantarii]ALK30628.1 sugar kinase [Burkholderia plantarii]GLZ19677.1 sugar kinase [Burkholderia plantarii]